MLNITSLALNLVTTGTGLVGSHSRQPTTHNGMRVLVSVTLRGHAKELSPGVSYKYNNPLELVEHCGVLNQESER